MEIETLRETKERLIIPPVSSIYPALGVAYENGGYEINHAGLLVRTGKHYYYSKAEIPAGFRMTTAGEELAIQIPYEIVAKILERTDVKDVLAAKSYTDIKQILESYAKTTSEKSAIQYVFDAESESIQQTIDEKDKLIIDPRKAKVFDDLFARGPDEIYMWQWTETGLRVPKGREAGKYETDAQGRKYWARIVLDGDKEIGEIFVPEGDSRLVAEWDEVFGVPRVTIENMGFPHKPYTTHFWFNATPNLDSTSGHYDVAVERWGYWHRDVDGGCLGVGASYWRLTAGSADGFRLVRGSLPEIIKKAA